MIIPKEALAMIEAGDKVITTQRRLTTDYLQKGQDKYGLPMLAIVNKVSGRPRYYKGRRYPVRKNAGSRSRAMVILEGIEPGLNSHGEPVWWVTLRPCGKEKA